jgi:CRISPR-associated protein Cas1
VKHLLNCLFVLTETSYLSLNNENVVVNVEEKELGRFPLHTLEQILYFGYKGASPALLGECAKRGVGVSFFRPTGKFLARVVGENRGNVLLRKAQYQMSDNETASCNVAKYFIVGKIFNSHCVLERFKRDHGLSVDVTRIMDVSHNLLLLANQAKACTNLEELRGIEGQSANLYFGVFNELILQDKDYFKFTTRNKRPPKDPINALLSFIYTLLALDCGSSLEGVGLDSYVGFLHRDRPGRHSLALDLMEELRSVYADRFVLTLINNRIVSKKSFQQQEDGAILLRDSERKNVLQAWQEKKKDIITHPFLEEKISWGLIPYVQALLLARYIRGDMDAYPAFLWK